MVKTDDIKSTLVYIGLGSNLDQPCLQVKKAIAALDNLPDTKVLKDSGYFKSKPMGPEDQPDYINAVVEIETSMTAAQLLNCCQQIEAQQGRVKKRHWGERSIDLDILLFGDQQINENDLVVPHPGICLRDFVYMPLLKLKPEIEIPGAGLLKHIVLTDKNQLEGPAKNNTMNTDFGCQFAGNIE